MSYVLRIDAHGGVIDPANGLMVDPMYLAKQWIVYPTVVTLHQQLTLNERGEAVIVGIIDDFGIANGLPLNRTAWALYGGSPIYGPMFIAQDDHELLPEQLVAALMGTDEWIGDAINHAMDDWLAREAKP